MRRLVLLSVLVACGSPPPRPALSLRLAMWGPLGILTAQGGNNEALAMVAQPWVYEPLARLDTAGELVPALASRVVPLSGDRYAVTIRPGATFSDGAPVSAREVIDSFAGRARVIEVNGTLEIETLHRAEPTIAVLSLVYVHRDVNGVQMGTGPFAVAEVTPTSLRLTRRRRDPLRVNEVEVLAFATPRDAFAHTLKGDANVIPDMEPRWLEFFRDVPSLQIVRGRGITTDSILFNMRLSREERLALAERFESRDVRELAYGDGCAESTLPSRPARELPPGDPLDIISWGPFERLAAAARRALGPRAGKVVYLPPRELLRRAASRDFDLLTIRPVFSPPVMMSPMWRTGAPSNANGYSNPRVDRALDQGDWATVRSALRDDPPAAFICTHDRLAVVDARIKNPRLGPTDFLETLPEWEVAQ